MEKKDITDYLMERKLRKTAPDLHRRVTDTEFAIQHILDGFKVLFPDYTDHTQLHCMTVIDFCNVLIGTEQIEKMNVDEIYVLLSACYLHDSGMGIRMKDYEEFKDSVVPTSYMIEHPGADVADTLRDFHHEFSGCFIRKYADMFDIPSPEHLYAIVQTSRGHRRTDLYDENEYPSAYPVPGGNTVCLPYLSALVRLADEIDVVASRNPVLLYDIESITDEISIIENMKLRAVKSLITNRDEFIMVVSPEDETIIKEIEKLRDKMQLTLDYCRDVTEKRTPFRITQKRVEMQIL